ncbi:uncharacterized protein [Haliotis asinina]|uniref:uncharacterized protein n=1 Tax=Haliotis asinina TaxID=109174 RepID=UPI003532783F
MSVSVDNPAAVLDAPSADLEWCFKPLMKFLDCIGMHMPLQRGKISNGLSVVYSVCFYVFMCLGNVRFFLFTSSIDTVGKWTAVLSYCGFHVACAYYVSATCVSINKHLPNLFKEFECYRETYGSAIDNAKIRRMVKVLMCLVLSIGIFNFFTVYLTIFDSVNDQALYLIPLGYIQEDYRLIFKLAHTIYLWLLILQVNAILGFFMICTFCISKEYSRLHAVIKHTFGTKGGDVPSTNVIDRIRRQFEDICGLVETANDVFKHVIGSCFIASIPVVCLMLYGFIQNDLMREEYLVLIECMIVLLTIVAVLTLTSVVLNFKAHAGLTGLLKIEFSRWSEKDLQIMNLFVTRITSTNIGYTVYNLFTVDSSTILMVSTEVVDLKLSGTLLTYVFVVLQFKPN